MKTKRYILSALGFASTCLLAQQTPAPTPAAPPKPPVVDPFIRSQSRAAEQVGGGAELPAVHQVAILFEAFSLDKADAAALLRGGLEDKALYDKLVEKTARKEAQEECLMALRARSGERALAEQISEQIYATAYTPPEIPNTLHVGDAKLSTEPSPQTQSQTQTQSASFFAATPALPVSFETRNVGCTLEIEPTVSGNGKLVDLRVAPNITTRAGTAVEGQGLAQTEMPVFETQRFDTSCTISVGAPSFMGTINRPPVSQVDPTAAGRVWLAFITATLVSP